MPRTDAIVDAGRKRARPIVMTTIAMVGGMLPSALGVGSGGEFRSPMAIAVIGGLMSSTLLSLVFVPAVFAVMDDIAKLGWRLFSPLRRPHRGAARAGAGGATLDRAPRLAHRRQELAQCAATNLSGGRLGSTVTRGGAREGMRPLPGRLCRRRLRTMSGPRDEARASGERVACRGCGPSSRSWLPAARCCATPCRRS